MKHALIPAVYSDYSTKYTAFIVPKKPWVSNYILVTLEVYHQYIIKPLKLWVLIMPNTPQQPSGYQGYKITIHYHG